MPNAIILSSWTLHFGFSIKTISTKIYKKNQLVPTIF